MTQDLQKTTTSYMKNYQKDFGIQISEKEARNSLYNLLGYVNTLEKIHRRIELDKRLKSKKFLKKFKSDNIQMATTSIDDSEDPAI